MTILILILTDMKKLNKNMVKNHVWKELYKLFDTFVDNSTGWKYTAQSKWKTADVFLRLAQASLENTSLEDVCDSYEGCSSDTVHYRLKKLDFDQTVSQINDMLRYTAQGFKIHKNQKIIIAIDITDHPWYGETDHELSVGSKLKAGTQFFNRYFTACIITKTYRIPVYFRPIRQEDGSSPHKLVEEMLREIFWWCPISRILADCWFFSLDLFEVLKMYKIQFLFNLKVRDKVKKRIEMVKETQRNLATQDDVDIADSKKFYQWLKKNELMTFKFESAFMYRNFYQFPVVLQTVLQKKQKGRKKFIEYVRLFSYTTNIDASGDYLKKLYKKRWGIETQYRVARQFLAKTCSQSTGLRIFLNGLSYVLTSLWLRLSLISNRIKEKKSEYIDFDLPLKIRITDPLIYTVSALKRIIRSEWAVFRGDDY